MAYQETPRMHDRTTGASGVPLSGYRVAWGGVWGGFLVGIGVFLLLSTLGLAIGVSTANIGPTQNLDAGRIGTGAAIWSGLTLLIALFIGGLVATRTGMVYDKASGFIEGVLVWVLSILAVMYMAGSGIGMLASGASGLLGGITQGATSVVRNTDMSELASGDVDRIIARLNEPETVQLVATATGMSQAEARSSLADIRQKVEAARNNPAQAAAAAKQGFEDLASQAGARVEKAAAKAQPYASATIWTALGAMVLALLAAVSGAMMGRRQVAKRLGEH
ncbi:MAG: hypothetical protein H0W40_06150 [Methylibium sp.]|nr:hypothetical protein [Methylibium sp.]